MKLLIFALVNAIFFLGCSSTKNEGTNQHAESHAVLVSEKTPAYYDALENSETLAVAYFASGCFWCVEAVFESVEGVSEAVSGYSGGAANMAKYEAVSYGRTKHAEAVKVFYDPEVVSYETLLEVFFGSHDPTTLNRQGPDKGTQYRSAIFFQNAEEEMIAKQTIARLEKEKAFDDPIVTAVVPFEAFYDAEDYHQNYEAQNPDNGYVKAVSIPRLNRFKKAFPHLLKKSGHSGHHGETKNSGVEKVVKTNTEWKKQLTEKQYYILRKKGTERSFTGEYWDNKKQGKYFCAACNNYLFASQTKFKSGTGWPSYYQPASEQAVIEHVDQSYGMKRVEVVCGRCDGHLGHVFDDGPDPTGLRYCINSDALKFIEEK